MRNIRVGKQTFVMTEKDEKKMEENFIDIYVVRQRIKKGWDYNEARSTSRYASQGMVKFERRCSWRRNA